MAEIIEEKFVFREVCVSGLIFSAGQKKPRLQGAGSGASSAKADFSPYGTWDEG